MLNLPYQLIASSKLFCFQYTSSIIMMQQKINIIFLVQIWYTIYSYLI